MNTLTRKTVFTKPIMLTIVLAFALPAGASQPKALLVGPNPDYCLPEFGFASFNIHGVGERVTYVRWGGLASRIGLEPGDTILSLNGYRLNYHGAWNDALSEAVSGGGWVHLTIRDVRTGLLAHRQTFVGDGPSVGPITPKVHVGGYHPPIVHHKHHVSHPVGPITSKSHSAKYGSHGDDVSTTIKKIAKLFD